MSLRTFRLKVFKAIKPSNTRISDIEVELALRMGDGGFVNMDIAQDERELGWWGLGDDMDIFVYLNDKTRQ